MNGGSVDANLTGWNVTGHVGVMADFYGNRASGVVKITRLNVRNSDGLDQGLFRVTTNSLTSGDAIEIDDAVFDSNRNMMFAFVVSGPITPNAVLASRSCVNASLSLTNRTGLRGLVMWNGRVRNQMAGMFPIIRSVYQEATIARTQFEDNDCGSANCIEILYGSPWMAGNSFTNTRTSASMIYVSHPNDGLVNGSSTTNVDVCLDGSTFNDSFANVSVIHVDGIGEYCRVVLSSLSLTNDLRHGILISNPKAPTANLPMTVTDLRASGFGDFVLVSAPNLNSSSAMGTCSRCTFWNTNGAMSTNNGKIMWTFIEASVSASIVSQPMFFVVGVASRLVLTLGCRMESLNLNDFSIVHVENGATFDGRNVIAQNNQNSGLRVDTQQRCHLFAIDVCDLRYEVDSCHGQRSRSCSCRHVFADEFEGDSACWDHDSGHVQFRIALF